METNHKAPLRLLLADDDEDDRDLFRDALDELALYSSIHTVTNGEEAISYLVENGHLLPDLIFLDLNMPNKNGKECLREIRAHTQLSGIPVIILSTSRFPNDVEETYRNGANLYVQKPSGYRLIVSVLEKVFRMHEEQMLIRPERNKFLLT